MEEKKETMVLVPFSKEDGQILEDTQNLINALLQEYNNHPIYGVCLKMCLEKLGKIEERYLEQKKGLDKLENQPLESGIFDFCEKKHYSEPRKLVPQNINTSTKEIMELPKSNITAMRPEIFALDFWNDKYKKSKKINRY